MKNDKLRFWLIAALAVVIVAAALTFTLNGDSKPSAKSSADAPSYLFVYEGVNAELKPNGDAGTSFTLAVPIKSEIDQVTWFTDRPYRDAGHISFKYFVSMFYESSIDSFKVDPPNVAISTGGATIIAEMTKPKIITLDNNQKAISATFIVIDDHKDKDIKKGKSMIDAHSGRGLDNPRIKKAMTLARVSVFVDNGVNYSLSPANYDGAGVGTSGVELQFEAGNAGWKLLLLYIYKQACGAKVMRKPSFSFLLGGGNEPN